MKLFILTIFLLVSQASYAYTCEERTVFMFLFKIQSIISQKIKGADSLSDGIRFCKSELNQQKKLAGEMMLACGKQKPDFSANNEIDDKMVEEFFNNIDNSSLAADEKKFNLDLVDKNKSKADLDLEKLCVTYGKGSPLIKFKLNH